MDGDLVAAASRAVEACDVARGARLPHALVRALHVLGDVERAGGASEAAKAAYEEALRVAEANGDRVGAAASLARRARLALASGDDVDALSLFADAVTLQVETGDGGLVSSLEAMAGLAVDQGRHGPAAGLFGAAEAIRRSLGLDRSPDEAADYERDVAALRAAMSEEDLATAWAQGAEMSREEAASLATRGRGARERPAFGWASLSPIESQIVDLVAGGLTNKEIGEKMFLSSRTVQGYLSRIFAKLGVSSRRELRDVRRQH